MSRAASIIAALAACVLAAPAFGGQTAPPLQEPPSPIEQAVMEHRCSMSRVPGVTATDAYQTCLSSQIASLRADFGVDLKKLSSAERRSLDAICSKVQVAEGRDAYVACISRQLSTLHNRRAGASQGPAPAAADPRAPAAAGAPADAAVPVPEPSPVATSQPVALWAGIAVVVAAGIAGGLVMMRKRRRTSTCRTCGAAFGETGDMCPKCRHEAAETLRRNAQERDERGRALAEEERRRAAHDEEQRRLRAAAEEQALRDQEQRARDEATARAREEERRREDEQRERQRFGDPTADSFDPYAVLGLPSGAGADQIRAAYQEAKAKYSDDVVAHLSEEVQAHYRAKAEAVERAYQMLAAGS